MPRSRDLERVHGELVEREVVARPVEHWEQISEPGAPMVVYVQQPTPVAEPTTPRQRLAPWWLALMAVAAAVALLVWALAGPPHIVRSDHKPPDLVNPSR